jgi:hypothetical protein
MFLLGPVFAMFAWRKQMNTVTNLRTHLDAGKRAHGLGLVLALACVAALAFLTACSSVGARKQQRAAAYEALSPTEKNLVEHGRIERGMDTNAVYIALGPPSAVVDTPATPPQTVWVYYGNRVVLIPAWSYFPTANGYWTLEYTPAHQSVPYTRAEVIFENGRVAKCQQF